MYRMKNDSPAFTNTGLGTRRMRSHLSHIPGMKAEGSHLTICVFYLPVRDNELHETTQETLSDLNLLDSPELLQILMTLTTVIKYLLPNFLRRAIVILNIVRRFRNFIADTVPCYKCYKNIASV